MDGLDLVGVVCDIMHHLQKGAERGEARLSSVGGEGVRQSAGRLHLVVHHAIRHLPHLTQDRQRVWEPVLGPGLRLVPAELALRTHR